MAELNYLDQDISSYIHHNDLYFIRFWNNEYFKCMF